MPTKIDLSKYGISNVREIVYNPSYEQLFAEETRPDLEGFEKGVVTESGGSSGPHRRLYRALSEGQVHRLRRHEQCESLVDIRGYA